MTLVINRTADYKIIVNRSRKYIQNVWIQNSIISLKKRVKHFYTIFIEDLMTKVKTTKSSNNKSVMFVQAEQ